VTGGEAVRRSGGRAVGESIALSLSGVEVRYHSRRVLQVDALELAAGNTLALLGPNGSGKSTLLRVLALLERPNTGSLTLLGEPVQDGERQRLALRRRTATVFQDPLLTDQTVFDNVAMGLRFRGLANGEIETRVGRWLTRFGVGHLAGQRARSLSGGEAQRVSLARAFVLEPEILFLDEPFGSLDLQGREALALELEVILREARIATVLVTHDRGEAQMLADQVAVLLEGRIAQCAPVRTVFERPATARVARFLGVENLLPVLCDGSEGLQLAGQRIALTPPEGLRRPLACLRAEDVHLSPAATPDAPGNVRLAATVVHAVPYGVPYRVHLDAGGVSLIALAARRTLDRLGVAPGARLVASFDPGALHLVEDDGPPVPPLPLSRREG
jgi:tungstate transport system ATP-binding protein